MKKLQGDLENSVVSRSDSKTPSGIGDMPMTAPARDAFKAQIEASDGILSHFNWYKKGRSRHLVIALGKVASYKRAEITVRTAPEVV